jgi:hypothetical protein
LSFGISTVVMGRVVHAAVAADAMRDGRPAIDLLAPISRLGANQWGHVGQVEEISRIGYHEWPGGYEPSANGSATG